MNIYIYIYVRLLTVVEGDLKIPFSIATTPRCRGGHFPFPWIVPLTFDLYLIMLSVKQGVKYHFLEWHRRFKEVRESVRDDERCGGSKEVRTPELIGQIKNFVDKDRRVSIETISAQFDVSVGTVHTNICEELKMRKICVKFVSRVLREDQKERCYHDNREMVELINSNPAVLDALVTCNESWIYCYNPETKRQSSQWKYSGSP